MYLRCRWLRKISLAIICISSLFGCADTSKKPTFTPSDAAQSEVDALRNLEPASPKSALDAIGFIKSLFNDPNDEKFAKNLGFASAKEAAAAQIGSPMRICNVSVDRLRMFQHGDDPNNLLVDTHQFLFPLIVNGQAWSSVTVMQNEKAEQKWRVVKKGAPKLIQKIQQQHPTSSTFLVLIPSLGLRFLGDREAQQLVLTALDENGRLHLKPGDQRRADEVFEEIMTYVQKAYDTDREEYLKSNDNRTSTTGGERC